MNFIPDPGFTKPRTSKSLYSSCLTSEARPLGVAVAYDYDFMQFLFQYSPFMILPLISTYTFGI